MSLVYLLFAGKNTAYDLTYSLNTRTRNHYRQVLIVDGAVVVAGVCVVLLVVVSLMGDGLFLVVVWLHKSSVWLSVAHMISQPV